MRNAKASHGTSPLEHRSSHGHLLVIYDITKQFNIPEGSVSMQMVRSLQLTHYNGEDVVDDWMNPNNSLKHCLDLEYMETCTLS